MQPIRYNAIQAHYILRFDVTKLLIQNIFCEIFPYNSKNYNLEKIKVIINLHGKISGNKHKKIFNL